jgi:putative transposase
VENGHQPTPCRERIMKRFLSVHDQVANLSRRLANKNSADHLIACARAFQAWAEITGIANAA